MTAETINSWSRRLGVTLRPWAGHSPVSLLARGVIQTAISALILTSMLRFAATGEAVNAAEHELAALRPLVVMVMIVFGLSIGIGVFRIVIGALDLAPRRQVTGTVVDLRERRMGDFLPRMAQRMIFERNDQGLDRRKWRTEVVLNTPEGLRQWTVRKRSLEQFLQHGAQVLLSVTPLAGYVASVEPVGTQPDPWT